MFPASSILDLLSLVGYSYPQLDWGDSAVSIPPVAPIIGFDKASMKGLSLFGPCLIILSTASVSELLSVSEEAPYAILMLGSV